MFKWLRSAVRQTDPGPEPAGSGAYDDSVKWFRKAAEKGTSWGQYNLGLSYARGKGVPQDYSEATKWFLQAAAQADAMSEYSLGQIYEKGLGIAADEVEAYKWFHLAAGRGIGEAEKARELLRQRLTTEQ